MTGPVPKPPAEIAITEDLVRSVLAAERPDLEVHPLVRVAEGWDNSMWRLGDDLSVRVPRRALAVPLLLGEQRWLPRVALGLTVEVPTPVHLGRPTSEYPWPWSICRWVPGRTLVDDPLTDQVLGASMLGDFLVQLHRPAPEDAPRSPYRGVPLSERDDSIRRNAAAVSSIVDVGSLLDMWDDALSAPTFESAAVWIHGDLHPRNVLAVDGVLSGVVDFGDMGAGDPAVDLSAAWTLLDAEGAKHMRDIYGADDATWRRARGWAVNHGILCLANSADEPTVSTIGRRTIARLLDDAD